jgi:hypothetical protein
MMQNILKKKMKKSILNEIMIKESPCIAIVYTNTIVYYTNYNCQLIWLFSYEL